MNYTNWSRNQLWQKDKYHTTNSFTQLHTRHHLVTYKTDVYCACTI